MRTGTDEGGWRYNSYFKPRGWSSHSGFAGWGGWVRRREWVRLRGIIPVQPGGDDEPPTEREEAKGGKSLGEILDSEVKERNLVAVEKALGRYALDREKLQAWDVWLKKADRSAKERLQAILDDTECVSTFPRVGRPILFFRNNDSSLFLKTRSHAYAQLHILEQQFTYRSSLPSFRHILTSHNLHIPPTAAPTSPFLTPPVSPSLPSTSASPPHDSLSTPSSPTPSEGQSRHLQKTDPPDDPSSYAISSDPSPPTCSLDTPSTSPKP